MNPHDEPGVPPGPAPGPPPGPAADDEAGFRHDRAGTPATAWADHPRWPDVARLSRERLARHDRLLVVAAHPDDETLGAAGLLRVAAGLGLETTVVVLTRGEGSHPDSPTHSRLDLARRRRVELELALTHLHPDVECRVLDVPDGAVAAHEDEVTAMLVGLLGEGRDALVVAPWRGDGHPDHEAAGRAAAQAAARCDAVLLEYPVWAWHWGDPADAPWPDWHDVVALDLTDVERVAKRRAVAAHRSQVAPLSRAPGDEVLLPPGVLAHFEGDRETFLRQPVDDERLERLHREQPEPWGADSRWYERRKRAALLAALPWERCGRLLEVGCSTGALTLDLAGRADEVVAIESSPTAAARARERLAREVGPAEGSDVSAMWRVDEGAAPACWPAGRFDVVVVSEVGYFLSPTDLDLLVERVGASLAPGGVVVLAHWRHPVAGWPLDGPEVHRRFRAAWAGEPLVAHTERDVELLVLGSAERWPDADA